MAKLPDVTSIDRALPQSQRGIVSYSPDQSGSDTQAISAQVVKTVDDLELAQGKLQVSYAEANLLRKKVEILNSFDTDQDYSTFQQRYEKEMQAAKEEQLKGISRADISSGFDAYATKFILGGLNEVQDKARKKQQDYTVASLMENSAAMQDAYFKGGAKNSAAIARNVNLMYEAARDSGAISAVQAVTLKQQWAEGIKAERSRREAEYDRALARQSEKNSFELYNQITNPSTRGSVTQDQIAELVRQDKLKGSDGRNLINLLNSDESKDDDLMTFAEFAKDEASGTLQVEDVIRAQAEGKLKNSTAKSLIQSVTSNLSQNESYKTGRELIRAEFDKSDFGVTKGDAAVREAEAMREFQRRAVEGENPLQVADSIVESLRKTSSSDRAYQRKLSDLRRKIGVKTSSVDDLEKAAQKIIEAGQRKTITEEEMNDQLGVIKRRIEELESGK